MLLSFKNKPLQLALMLVTLLIVAAFPVFAQSGQSPASRATNVRTGRVADVADIALNPDQYMGKRVTVQWKVDKVYSPTTIGLEKDEHHLLVVWVPPATASTANMKKGEPITATGTVENFDSAKFEREYGKLDFGNAPLDKFNNKPVLVVTGAKSTRLQNSQGAVAGRQKPSTQEQTPSTESQPASLPRTASALPALGLVGLLSLMMGLALPLLRRQ